VAVRVVGSAQNIQVNTRYEGMTAQYVKTGLYVISGRGSNSVLRLSANGLILVDGKLPGGYDALLGQVKRISKQPIRALILTSYDESRTGTNANFLEHGTSIIVQENAKVKPASPDSPNDKPAAPIVTYNREYGIHLGGVDVQLFHFGKAHSNSDTVVYFPNLKAVALGDLYASTPDPDFSAGGSLTDWGAVLAQVLKLDFDVAIPSTGPAVSRADVEAFKAKIDTFVSRAAELVQKGVPNDQLMSQVKTDDLGWRSSFSPDQADAFSAELVRSGQPKVHSAQLNVPPAEKQ
jgi:glyoxylase-like metal-dependent hydrolase (beta-lactamase superfamily II)